MKYNATRLDGELKAAGLLIHGCDSDGGISWVSPPTPDQEAIARQILAAHDPTPRPSRWQQHHDRLDSYGLPELRALLKEMLAERLPRQA